MNFFVEISTKMSTIDLQQIINSEVSRNNLPSEYTIPSIDSIPSSKSASQEEFKSSLSSSSTPPSGDFFYNPATQEAELAKMIAKTTTFNHSAVEKPTAFPYLITKANYGPDFVYLYDFDSKRIVLTYSGDLEIDINGVPMKKSTMPFNTPHGSKNGYVFWKSTKSNLDLLDKLFGEWRGPDFLKVPLPPLTEERDPSILWTGLIGNINAELLEYSDKSVVLITTPPSQKGDWPTLGAMFNWSLKHPTRGKVAGHIISKNKLGPLQLIIPIDFGSLFTKSAPVILKQTNKFSPILLVSEKQMSGTQIFTLKQYRYSEASYALTFDPPADISNEVVQINNGLVIDGKKQSGFIFAISNKAAIDYLKAIFPKAKTDDEMPGLAMASNISAPVPVAPKMEQRISDIAISLILKLSNVTDIVTEEAHNKIIYYGPSEKLESIDVEPDDLLMSLTVGDKQLIVTKRN
jgi:hypothetical protein